MSQLFSPLKLPCGVSIPNRICKASMTEGLATKTGSSTDELASLYQTWSEGGAGLLLSGNFMVDGRFLERSGNVVLDQSLSEKALKKLAASGTKNGNQFWVQINHPGRQCNRFISGTPVSPSDVQLKLAFLYGTPKQLSHEEILEVIQKFVDAAVKVKRCGFTGVNSLRSRLPGKSIPLSPYQSSPGPVGYNLETVQDFSRDHSRSKKAVGSDYPVAVKLNSSDFQKGGFSIEESLQVAEWVSKEEVDLLEISGGTCESLEFLRVRRSLVKGERPFSSTMQNNCKGRYPSHL